MSTRRSQRRTSRCSLAGGSALALCALLIAFAACTPSARTTRTSESHPNTPSASPSFNAVPSVGWKVNASTVGLAPLGLSCDSLPTYAGDSKVPHGARISGVLITKPLDLSSGDIVIQRSCIQPNSVGQGMPVLATTDYNTMKITMTKVTIEDCDIDGSKLDAKSAALATAFIGVADLIGNYIHGFGSGIGIMNTGNTLDALVVRNYVTGLVAWGDPATTGNHSDAFTIRDFSDVRRVNRKIIVRDNRFDCRSGNDTGALFIQTYGGRIDNVLIEGNLLEGNNYQLQLQELNDPYSNVRAINNRMTGTGYGPLNIQGGPGFVEFSDNYAYVSTAANGEGRAISQ